MQIFNLNRNYFQLLVEHLRSGGVEPDRSSVSDGDAEPCDPAAGHQSGVHSQGPHPGLWQPAHAAVAGRGESATSGADVGAGRSGRQRAGANFLRAAVGRRGASGGVRAAWLLCHQRESAPLAILPRAALHGPKGTH